MTHIFLDGQNNHFISLLVEHVTTTEIDYIAILFDIIDVFLQRIFQIMVTLNKPKKDSFLCLTVSNSDLLMPPYINVVIPEEIYNAFLGPFSKKCVTNSFVCSAMFQF